MPISVHYFLVLEAINISTIYQSVNNALQVAKKYRYPMHRELLWYVVAGIVKRATGLVYDVNKALKEVGNWC